MPATVQMIGRTFGRLTVKSQAPEWRDSGGKPRKRFFCDCECGRTLDVLGEHLRANTIRSCGCFRKEAISLSRRRHGDTIQGKTTPEYESWAHIVQRCTNPANKDFKYYGGRGISICDKWRSDYASFLEHVGRKPTPKHSIDRIDNEGNYEPGNVQWATQSMQVTNRRFLGFHNRKPQKAGTGGAQ